MSPNLDSVLAVDIDKLKEDGDFKKINALSDQLAEVNILSIEDSAKVEQVVELYRGIVDVKNAELEVIQEDNDRQHDKSERQHRTEMAFLESELEKAKRFSKDSREGVDPVHNLRQEIVQIERQLKMTETELSESRREVERERNNSQMYITKINNLESDVRKTEELKKENEQLRVDINDYIQRLKNVSDAGSTRHHEDIHHRQILQEKNKELLKLNDENINLSQHNARLEEELKVMKESMNTAMLDMHKMTEDYVKMKTVLSDTDAMLENQRKETQKLKLKVTDMRDQVKSKMDTEDEIMVAVNEKVEEWKLAIENKNDQIADYEREIMDLRQQLIAMSMDSERVKMAALEKAVEERDNEIKSLQSKLSTAVEDIEQSNALIEDLRSQFTKEFSGGGTAEFQLMKIRELQASVRDSSKQSKTNEERMLQAEQDAREKDKQLAELMDKMREYETGMYGLSDAVAEIKECKLQVQIRDRQIVELTQNVNGLGNQLNDLADENEELRDRLGLEPADKIDLTRFRNQKNVQREEEKAMNQILQREVEKLEEERLQLKQQIRKLAQKTGQRAVALGLTNDDMHAIEEFTETLKRKNAPFDVGKMKKDAETDELKVRALQLEQESEKHIKDMERIRQTNADLNMRVKKLDEENKNLEHGLKEVLNSVKESNQRTAGKHGVQSVNIESPTLERMLSAIEAKQITGNYDAALHLKSQVDNLTGRNDELRRELREARIEGNRCKLELQKTQLHLTKVEDDLKVVRDAGGMGMLFQTLALPEGMAVSSADVIASLNEHLVQTLHELSQKEELLAKTESGLEVYKGKFAVARHQIGLIYVQYEEERLDWQKKIELTDKNLRELEGTISEDKIRVQEYNRLIDTLDKDDIEARRRLSDMTRKITVLRVNEKALTRRYNMMVEIEGQLRKENSKLKNEQLMMEKSVTERLGYLSRYKEMASFKIATLQKSKEESVPVSELELANKQYEALTEKYRDLLERNNKMIASNEHSATLEVELKRVESEKSTLLKELEIEKEKTHAYQASLEQLKRQGVMTSSKISDEDMTMAKKLATLEMKEINERQRAEHAMRMFEQRKELVSELEFRNSELEQKFSEVTRMNLESQRIERELRDELSDCVLKSVSDADRAKIAELEKSENSLKIENSRLKEIADVALSQASSMELQKVSQEKELRSLRQQLIDIQSQSDEKKVIGKLHRTIVQLQVSEGTALKKLEDACKKVTKLQAQLLRMDQRLDEKDQSLLHHKSESANKSRHLRRTIHELRRMFSGSVPISKQEKFARAMIKLQEDKDSFAKQLKQVQEDRMAVEDRLAELRVQHSSLQELMSTLKDGKGASKVAEWHSKMEHLRLEELKKSRQINRLSEQIGFMQTSIRQHETTISVLEDENVKLNRHYEERQLQWEQREMEMERIIAKLEGQQKEIAGAASKFEEATGTLPDITLPVTEQLEQAISTIKNNVRIILETQAESRQVKQNLSELQHKLKEAEANLLSRDRVIAELRLRLPSTSERDDLIAKATSGAQYQEEQYETKQALRVAQSTIGSLQARISQKEETITKLQTLLKSARDEMSDLCTRHETDMKLMIDRLHIKTDQDFTRVKSHSIKHINSAPPGTITHQQLARLNELEDTVIQQDNQIAALSQRLREAHADIDRWRNQHEQLTVNLGREKETIIREHHDREDSLNTRIEHLTRKVNDLSSSISQLEVDLQLQRDANNRAPTVAMKNLVEKLKQQLEQKESELKKMGLALTELRADLVQQAEQQVRLNSKESASDWNVQKLLDKKTKDLQDKIEDLESEIEHSKTGGKRRRDKEHQLQLEIEELKDEMSRKDSTLDRLKESKRRLEEDNENLERRVDRLNQMKKEGGSALESEQLKSQIRSLESQLADARFKLNMAEKPSEEIIRQTAPKLSSAVEKWEETKKFQKQIERLKTKIQNLETDNNRLKTNSETMKNVLDRTTKAKEALEKKTYKHAPPLSYGKTAGLNEQQLQQQNQQLLEEVSDLRQQLSGSRDAAYQQVNARNQELTRKLAQLEDYVSHRSDKPSSGDNSYPEIIAREQKLQNDLLKTTEENITLRFEITTLQQEIPKLKEKVSSQSRYIEALKLERVGGDNMSVRSNGSLGSIGSGISAVSSSIRRIGESGRTPKELERTIALLKKVVDKQKRENEALKMAPGIVSNEKLTYLERENDGLKNQLDELRSKMGTTLTERYDMKEAGTKKLTTDYERLRKDLRKEQEQSERLQVHLNSARLTIEQLNKEIEELKSRIAIEPNMSQLDHKGWKAAVVTKMSEEKLVRVQAELDNKVKMLADMKILLKDSATRENQLINENGELKRQVSILERFPEGSNLTDSELMAQYQKSRLKLNQLESEKSELLQEIRRIKGHSLNDLEPSVIEKSRNYDRVVRDQAEQTSQFRQLELEHKQIQQENIKMKKELANFGPEFFEEIEDLKYNYKESEIKNVQLEQKIQLLCQQFGVPYS